MIFVKNSCEIWLIHVKMRLITLNRCFFASTFVTSTSKKNTSERKFAEIFSAKRVYIYGME